MNRQKACLAEERKKVTAYENIGPTVAPRCNRQFDEPRFAVVRWIGCPRPPVWFKGDSVAAKIDDSVHLADDGERRFLVHQDIAADGKVKSAGGIRQRGGILALKTNVPLWAT